MTRVFLLFCAVASASACSPAYREPTTKPQTTPPELPEGPAASNTVPREAASPLAKRDDAPSCLAFPLKQGMQWQYRVTFQEQKGFWAAPFFEHPRTLGTSTLSARIDDELSRVVPRDPAPPNGSTTAFDWFWRSLSKPTKDDGVGQELVWQLAADAHAGDKVCDADQCHFGWKTLEKATVDTVFGRATRETFNVKIPLSLGAGGTTYQLLYEFEGATTTIDNVLLEAAFKGTQRLRLRRAEPPLGTMRPATPWAKVPATPVGLRVEAVCSR